ncbi:Protein will die slowly [Gryllus bimaculatus]|nr:Protein will die slowly [Gryllus bimaculatus]
MQHSLLYKEDLAHLEGVWCCAWGRKKEKKSRENQELAVTDVDEEASCSFLSETKEMYDILITGSVNYAKIWSFKNDKLEMKHKLSHPWGVVAVSINSDGTKFASTTLEPSVFLWDLESAEKIKSIDLEINDIYKAAFTPDDKLIAFGKNTGCVLITDVEPEEYVEELRIYPEGNVISTVAMSSDGKYIGCGSLSGILEIFDAATGRIMHRKKGEDAAIHSVCFSIDCQFLLAASDIGHIEIYETKTGDMVGRLPGRDARILSLAFSPDNQHFVSSNSDNSIQVWDIRTQQCLHTFTEHSDVIWDITYNPDGNKIMSVSEDKSINIYESVVD